MSGCLNFLTSCFDSIIDFFCCRSCRSTSGSNGAAHGDGSTGYDLGGNGASGAGVGGAGVGRGGRAAAAILPPGGHSSPNAQGPQSPPNRPNQQEESSAPPPYSRNPRSSLSPSITHSIAPVPQARQPLKPPREVSETTRAGEDNTSRNQAHGPDRVAQAGTGSQRVLAPQGTSTAHRLLQPLKSPAVPAPTHEVDTLRLRVVHESSNANVNAERATGPEGAQQAAGTNSHRSLPMGGSPSAHGLQRPPNPSLLPATREEGANHSPPVGPPSSNRNRNGNNKVVLAPSLPQADSLHPSATSAMPEANAYANPEQAIAPGDPPVATINPRLLSIAPSLSMAHNPRQLAKPPTVPTVSNASDNHSQQMGQQAANVNVNAAQALALDGVPLAVNNDSHRSLTIHEPPIVQKSQHLPAPPAVSAMTNEGDDPLLQVARESPGPDSLDSATMRSTSTGSKRQPPEPPTVPAKSNEGDDYSPRVEQQSIDPNVNGDDKAEQAGGPDGVPQATPLRSLTQTMGLGRKPTTRRPQQPLEPSAVPATREGSNSRVVQQGADAKTNAEQALASDGVSLVAGAISHRSLTTHPSSARNQNSPELPSVPTTTNAGDDHSRRVGRQATNANTAQASASEDVPQAAGTNPHRFLTTHDSPIVRKLQQPPAVPTMTNEGDDRPLQVTRESLSSNSHHSSTMRRTPTASKQRRPPEHPMVPAKLNEGDGHSSRVEQQSIDPNVNRNYNAEQASGLNGVPQAAGSNSLRALSMDRRPTSHRPQQPIEPPAVPATTNEGDDRPLQVARESPSSDSRNSSTMRRMPTASEQRQPREPPMVSAKLSEGSGHSSRVEQQSTGQNIIGNHNAEQASGRNGVPQAAGSNSIRSLTMDRQPTAQRLQQPLEPAAVPATTKEGSDHSSQVAQQAANPNAERGLASDGAPSAASSISHRSLATRDSPATRKPRQSPKRPAVLATTNAGGDHSSRVGQRAANTSFNPAQAPAADSVSQAAGTNLHLPLARRGTPTTREPRQPPEHPAVLAKPNADDDHIPRVGQRAANANDNSNSIQTSAPNGVPQAASTISQRSSTTRGTPTAQKSRQPGDAPAVPAMTNDGNPHNPPLASISPNSTSTNANAKQVPDGVPEAAGADSLRLPTTHHKATTRRPKQPPEPPAMSVTTDEGGGHSAQMAQQANNPNHGVEQVPTPDNVPQAADTTSHRSSTPLVTPIVHQPRQPPAAPALRYDPAIQVARQANRTNNKLVQAPAPDGDS
jgi:hypothetical protein